MGLNYQAVLWNRQKKLYDYTLLTGVVLYLGIFVGASLALYPDITVETAIIRGFGTGALLLLHIVLSIGPLCRINSGFLPLLYNRRHMGVTMFILALVHGLFSIIQFHTLGNINPILSVLLSNQDYASIMDFPFQPLGLAALVILFLMAATSHDFWMANLTPPVWKALHMLVYFAYGLTVLHVAFGVLQAETNSLFPLLLGIGLVWLLVIHLIAGMREKSTDVEKALAAEDGFVKVGHVDEIENNHAKIVTLSGERVAIFRYDGKVSVISNVCQHQNGPLGEGQIIDGLVTCPWHGFQYDPADGASPAPFKEKIPTFNLKVIDGDIFVDPRPNLPGTRVEPAKIV